MSRLHVVAVGKIRGVLLAQESIALPDVHSGYGFAIGNVAAFDMADPEAVVSPGGVGFDINCGVRLIRTNLASVVFTWSHHSVARWPLACVADCRLWAYTYLSSFLFYQRAAANIEPIWFLPKYDVYGLIDTPLQITRTTSQNRVTAFSFSCLDTVS